MFDCFKNSTQRKDLCDHVYVASGKDVGSARANIVDNLNAVADSRCDTEPDQNNFVQA
jgi:hypothetical protein